MTRREERAKRLPSSLCFSSHHSPLALLARLQYSSFKVGVPHQALGKPVEEAEVLCYSY